MYRLIRERFGLELREEQRGGHYEVRAASEGRIGAQWVCAGGERCEEILVAPETFLRTHPDIAQVPGVGVALRELTKPPHDGRAGFAG